MPSIYEEIEELRRQLHRVVGPRFDPACLPALLPISEQLDRLTLLVCRLEQNGQQAKTPASESQAYEPPRPDAIAPSLTEPKEEALRKY
jgi:hypothetical protein